MTPINDLKRLDVINVLTRAMNYKWNMLINDLKRLDIIDDLLHERLKHLCMITHYKNNLHMH